MFDLSILTLLTYVAGIDISDNAAIVQTSAIKDTRTQSQGRDSSNRPTVESQRSVSLPESIPISQSSHLHSLKSVQAISPKANKVVPQPSPPETFAQRQVVEYSTREHSLSIPLPVLKLGSQGERVRNLQERLQQLGNYNATVDGIYGNLTVAAVSRFQRSEGLSVDGIIGSLTWNKLQALSIASSQNLAEEDKQKTSISHVAPQISSKNSIPTQESIPIDPDDSHSAYAYRWLLEWIVVCASGFIFIFSPNSIRRPGFKLKSLVKGDRFKRIVQAVHSMPKPIQPDAAIVNRQQPEQVSSPDAYSYKSQLHVASLQKFSRKVSQNLVEHQLSERNPSKEAVYLDDFKSLDQKLAVVLANEGVIEELNNLVVDLSDTPRTTKLARSATLLRKDSDRPLSPFTLPHPNDQPRDVKGTLGTLIAVLPANDPQTGNGYTYSLVDDAEGRFKLEGNELRSADELMLKSQRNNIYTIVVRRTRSDGVYTDKSFTLDFNMGKSRTKSIQTR